MTLWAAVRRPLVKAAAAAADSAKGVCEAARAPQDLRRRYQGDWPTNLFAKGVFSEKLIALMRRIRSAHHFAKNIFSERAAAERLIFTTAPPPPLEICAGRHGVKTSR
jgi:hypothetical protein